MKFIDWHWVTKEMVKKINDFLNNKVYLIEYEVLKGKTDTWENDDWCNTVLLKAMLYNKDVIEKDIIKRNIVYSIINKLSNITDKNNYTSLEGNYYVYNKDADKWKNFYIGKFQNPQDNFNESKWFENYLNDVYGSNEDEVFKYLNHIFSVVYKLRTNGYTLAKSSTITLENAKHMVRNYCVKNTYENFLDCNSKYEQNFAVYNAESVDSKYDSLLSTNIKTFRGYVRYVNRENNNFIKWTTNLIKDLSDWEEVEDSVKFALLLLSFFVKDTSLKQEEEYRHIVITDSNSINGIKLSVVPSSGKYKFNPCTLNYKKENHSDCLRVKENNFKDTDKKGFPWLLEELIS